MMTPLRALGRFKTGAERSTSMQHSTSTDRTMHLTAINNVCVPDENNHDAEGIDRYIHMFILTSHHPLATPIVYAELERIVRGGGRTSHLACN